MVYTYIMSIGLLILEIMYFYIVGTAMVSNSKSFAYRIVIGYIIYSFFIAIVGIPVQFLNIEWYVFAIYMPIMMIVLLCYSLKRIKKYSITTFSESNKDFLSNHWVLFIVPVLCLIVSMLNIKWQWTANCSDNGYYITRIVSLPYYGKMLGYNFASGLKVPETIANTYLLNTWDLEQSVIIFGLKLMPTIYLKFSCSLLQYIIMAMTIYALAEKMVDIFEFEINKKYLQYTVSIMLVFVCGQTFLESNHLLTVYDSWQFTIAMFFGSSFVRTMGIIMVLLPFINNEKLYKPDIVLAIGMAIVLVSKSTIAVPLIFVTVVSYYLVEYLFDDWKHRIFSVVIFMIISGVANVLPVSVDYQNDIIQTIQINATSPILIISFVFFVLSFFTKNKIVIKMNLIIILLFLFCVVSPFNSYFALLSGYEFVVKRTLTAFIYTFVIINFIYMFILAYKVFKKGAIVGNIGRLLLVLCIGCSMLSLIYDPDSPGLVESTKMLINNPKLLPETTYQLAAYLSEYQKKSETDLCVVTSSYTYPNAYQHPLSVCIREYAPNVIDVSAIWRYKNGEGNEFSKWVDGFQNSIDSFINGKYDKNVYTEARQILTVFPINCIVMNDESKTTILNRWGFKEIHTISDSKNNVHYYIYYKE